MITATTGLTTVDRLLDYLRTSGADAERGQFLVRGSITIGLGEVECCLGESAQYRRGGLWEPIRMEMIVSAMVF